jgi:hypothetical protein
MPTVYGLYWRCTRQNNKEVAMSKSTIEQEVVQQMWDFYRSYDVNKFAVKADSLHSVSGPTSNDPKQETLGGPEMIVDSKGSPFNKNR